MASRLSVPTNIRNALRLAVKYYKAATNFVQYLSSQTRDPIDRILHFIENIGKLSETIQSFFDYQNNKDSKASKVEGSLNKMLVFELERFQTATVKYSKKVKVDLNRYFKRSTARAFQISKDIVDALNLKRKEPPKDTGIIDSDEEAPVEEPPRKKQRNSGIIDSDEETEGDSSVVEVIDESSE